MAIRDGTDSDVTSIYSLFKKNRYFEEDVSLEEFANYYRWLYANCARNIQYNLVADHDASIVAHYAMIPIEYVESGTRVLAGLGSNLLVDSKHRNGLLFLNLQQRFLRGYAAKGISFTYGLVTRPSVLQTHLRTGYTRVGTIPVLARPFRVNKLVASVLKNKALLVLANPFCVGINTILSWIGSCKPHEDWSVEEVNSFPDEIAAMTDSAFPEDSIHAVRGSKELNWRFAQFISRGYRIFLERYKGRITGYMVTRVMPMREFQVLAVVDVVLASATSNSGSGLQYKIHLLAREAHVDLAATICNPTSQLAKFFRKAFFLKTPEKFTLVINRPRSTDYFDEAGRFSRWYITWFDSDVV